MLTATAYGLGSCWVGAFNEEEVRRILNLEPNLRPVAIIPIGQPAAAAEPVPKRPVEEVVMIYN